MVVHYGQLDKVMMKNDANSLFAEYAVRDQASDSWAVERVGHEFRKRNILQGFKPIFG